MRRFIFYILLLIFILPINILSCVVVFYRSEPLIYEIKHRSIVIYDRANQKVGFIPQISFRGRPQDFCVVVPTPTPPKLNPVSGNVFYEAEQLTSPEWSGRSSGCFFSGDFALEERDQGSSVSIISEKSVGVYDTVTLFASSSDNLVKWLNDNGYRYSVQDKEILDYYIQKNWFFTAMKIDSSSLSGMTDYYYGYNINPVIFRYSASAPIYPMHLASINAEDSTDLIVYVLSDSKMTFTGAKVEYANKIDDKELKEILNDYPAFGGLIGQNRYLTKLRRTFSIMEMESDIEITSASDNKEFKDIIYYGFSPLSDFIPLGIVVGILLFINFLLERKRKAQNS
ncbi:TPA: DUF2330 domain-containing protein [bacterium]|nr:DUF2330 domain-containing protein [bacterium]